MLLLKVNDLFLIRMIRNSFFLVLLGNYTVDARASPMLFDVIVEASKMVYRLSLYDFFSLIRALGSKCI